MKIFGITCLCIGLLGSVFAIILAFFCVSQNENETEAKKVLKFYRYILYTSLALSITGTLLALLA